MKRQDMERWERELFKLLNDMGDKLGSRSKLENLTRYAWEEARAIQKRLAEPGP